MGMGQAQVRSFDGIPGAGNVIQKLRANNWDINKALRTNATLPRSAWEAIDQTVVEVAGQRLNGIADLQSRGLVRNLDGMGFMYDTWQTMSDSHSAEQSMSGLTQGAQNTADYDETTIPLPITHVDFQIPLRKLMAMEQRGTPLDTTMVAQATRKVIEKLEDTLFNGSTVVAAGNSLLGYMNYTDANQITTLTGSWTGTIANCEKDLALLMAELETDRHFGPYILYVHANEWNDLQQRDSSAGGISYYEILKSKQGIIDIKPTEALSANDIVLVEMTRETVDITVALDITVVEWETYGGMQSNFKVMAVMAPRIKSDYNGRCGVTSDTDIGSS